MLHREIKILFIAIVVISTFFGCNKYKKYNEKEIAAIRVEAMAMSQSILGKENYFAVYQMANDTIINWSKHELGKWKYFGNLTDYQLDSVFCVNKTGDKVIFSILRRTIISDADGDGISYFYGVKIRNTWYFFEGAYLVLLREFYQANIHTPLSFDKLEHIAADHIYRGYLIKDKSGQWVVNDKFFENYFYNKGVCSQCVTEEDFEKVWKYNALSQWNKK